MLQHEDKRPRNCARGEREPFDGSLPFMPCISPRIVYSPVPLVFHTPPRLVPYTETSSNIKHSKSLGPTGPTRA